MIFRAFFLTIIILIFQGILFAEIKIFLLPRIEMAEGNVVLSDVSIIDCDNETLDEIASIEITQDIYKDGYIDIKELRNLLMKNSVDSIYIYGDAVRIVSKSISNDGIGDLPEERDVVVNQGERINLILKRNGISLELSGTLVEEGRPGEEVKVKLKGSKVLRGVLKNRRLVEVTI